MAQERPSILAASHRGPHPDPSVVFVSQEHRSSDFGVAVLIQWVAVFRDGKENSRVMWRFRPVLPSWDYQWPTVRAFSIFRFSVNLPAICLKEVEIVVRYLKVATPNEGPSVPVDYPQYRDLRSPNSNEVHRWHCIAHCKVGLLSLLRELVIERCELAVERKQSYHRSDRGRPTTKRSDPFSNAGAVVLIRTTKPQLRSCIQPNECGQSPHEAECQTQRQMAVLVPTHERVPFSPNENIRMSPVRTRAWGCNRLSSVPMEVA